MGQRPDAVNPDFIEPVIAEVKATGCLRLAGHVTVLFDWAEHMRFMPVSLPHHPNALRICAHGSSGQLLHDNTYYSIGGGFVIDETQFNAGEGSVAKMTLPYEFDSAAALLAIVITSYSIHYTKLYENT